MMHIQRNADTMLAGIDVWSMLMHKIGKGRREVDTRGSFEDLMLKEWARVYLSEDKMVCVCVCI